MRNVLKITYNLKMSIKSCDRVFRKDKSIKSNRKSNPENASDEIALRDEILELKRQIMMLKKTNEQNMVKFRKYEDEAKRKDRQIEQLMDPRKYAEITKILSTKGAAILMNLKDQNNSLIQIILNKDIQIRRLIAEIKMSKLYAGSRKSEPYKAEVIRLRNLLIKSQESLKESINFQHKQHGTTSICVNENPLLEMSSSSDQSSPRELEELRYTIQSLETHIKYSNDLLAKKNQEILLLSYELNVLKQIIQKKSGKISTPNQPFDYTPPECFTWKENTKFNPTFQWINEKPENSIEPVESVELFEKTAKILEYEKPPNSAPTSSISCLPYDESTPKHNSMSNIFVIAEDYKEPVTEQKVLTVRKSLIHNLVANEMFKEEKMHLKVEKKYKMKEKWKYIWTKYKQSKLRKDIQESGKNEDKINLVEGLEAHEFESMEKAVKSDCKKSKTFHTQEKIYECEENLEEIEKTEDFWIKSEINSSEQNKCNDQALKCDIKSEELENEELNFESQNMIENIKREISSNTFSPEIQRELRNLCENVTAYEETERKAGKFLKEVYRESLDSSLDSEYGYPVKRVEVEVQINSVPSQNENFHCDTISGCSEILENQKPDLELKVNDNQTDDDDDVIIR